MTQNIPIQVLYKYAFKPELFMYHHIALFEGLDSNKNSTKCQATNQFPHSEHHSVWAEAELIVHPT